MNAEEAVTAGAGGWVVEEREVELRVGGTEDVRHLADAAAGDSRIVAWVRQERQLDRKSLDGREPLYDGILGTAPQH